MCRAAIYDARNNLSNFIKIAESGEPVELTRHDKPVAVIISWEEWEKRKPKENFITWLMKFREENKDIFEDPDWEGLPIEKDEYLDEEYEKKIDAMWGKINETCLFA